MRAVHFDLSWGYWLATAMLLTLGLAGWAKGVTAAIVLTAVQLVHFAHRVQGRDTFPLQVRVLYFAALLLGLAHLVETFFEAGELLVELLELLAEFRQAAL